MGRYSPASPRCEQLRHAALNLRLPQPRSSAVCNAFATWQQYSGPGEPPQTVLHGQLGSAVNSTGNQKSWLRTTIAFDGDSSPIPASLHQFASAVLKVLDGLGLLINQGETHPLDLSLPTPGTELPDNPAAKFDDPEALLFGARLGECPHGPLSGRGTATWRQASTVSMDEGGSLTATGTSCE